jgi:hypothetical protein
MASAVFTIIRAIPCRGLRLTSGGRPRRHWPRGYMQTLQLYAIWFLLSIGLLGGLLAWRLM